LIFLGLVMLPGVSAEDPVDPQAVRKPSRDSEAARQRDLTDLECRFLCHQRKTRCQVRRSRAWWNLACRHPAAACVDRWLQLQRSRPAAWPPCARHCIWVAKGQRACRWQKAKRPRVLHLARFTPKSEMRLTAPTATCVLSSSIVGLETEISAFQKRSHVHRGTVASRSNGGVVL